MFQAEPPPATPSAESTRLSVLAHIGRVILVLGVLVLASLLLNLAGVDFKGFQMLDRLGIGSLTVRLIVGLAIVGWVIFRVGGGKEAVAAQRRQLGKR